MSFNEKREFEQLEKEIEEMETRKKEIDTLMTDGGSDFEILGKLSQELETLNKTLDQKSDRWLELMEILEGE